MIASTNSIELANAREIFAQTFFDALRPDPRVSVSEWAEEHRWLTARTAAEPGKWRNARTPYLVEIMDALSPQSSVESVAFMKGSQIGATEAGNNWLGAIIDRYPGPVMIVWPTVDIARDMSKDRVQPLIDSTPRLARLVLPNRERDSGNTTLKKDFPGGTLSIVGANSAASLRSRSVKYLFLDEIDAYPGDVEGEGDPVELAEVRTNAFSQRKIFKASSPKFAGTSRIERAFLAGDQRRYHVPCPHCGFFQPLVWERIQWEKGQPETVWYRCESCAAAIYEASHKPAMLAKGKWVAHNPSAPAQRRSYQLSALYSPVGLYSWKKAVEKFEEAEAGNGSLQVWINTVLGEPWKLKGDAPDWERLFARRESFAIGKVPFAASVITAGADVQQNRIEVEIVAWGANMESWSIDYRVFPGDTADDATWAPLAELVGETFEHPSGVRLPIRMLAVDAGFAQSVVCNWTRTQPRDRVIATKGSGRLGLIYGQPKQVDINLKGRRIPRGAMLWFVGSGIVKSELYGWLKLEPPTDPAKARPRGFAHFPQYGEEYFRQLCAEQLIRKKTKSGYSVYEWEPTRDRNEALDCRVYARAALSISGCDRWRPEHWIQNREILGLDRGAPARQTPEGPEGSTTPAPAPPPTPSEPKKSRGQEFWGRRSGRNWL